MLNFILDLLFPPVCGFCDQISKDYLCENCKEKLKKLEKFEIIKYQNNEKYFNKHIYIYEYKELIREILIKYKFKQKSYIHKTLVENIIKNKKICRILKNYDIIISVPIHTERRLKRGYDQSYLIAKELSKKLNIKTYKNVLIKTVNNKPQSSLKKYERLENVVNAYKIKNIEVNLNKKILLLDDIYTTGNTVDECSKILKNAGAKEVGILTIAKD